MKAPVDCCQCIQGPALGLLRRALAQARISGGFKKWSLGRLSLTRWVIPLRDFDLGHFTYIKQLSGTNLEPELQ